jgi:hypothetical protein
MPLQTMAANGQDFPHVVKGIRMFHWRDCYLSSLVFV